MTTEYIVETERPNLMKRFRDPKSFSPRAVEPGKLLDVLDAGRQTESYQNEQPWSFVITTKASPTDHQRLLSCLARVTAVWAGNAPVLILAAARLHFDSTGIRNDYAFHDVTDAVSNIVAKSNALGMVAHRIGGFDAARARDLFAIPSGYAPVSVLAIGYPGELGTGSWHPEHRDTSFETRRPLQSIAFAGNWGKPLGGLEHEDGNERSTRNDAKIGTGKFGSSTCRVC